MAKTLFRYFLLSFYRERVFMSKTLFRPLERGIILKLDMSNVTVELSHSSKITLNI